MATQKELSEQIRSVTAQLGKIGVETGNTLAKVIELQAVIDAGNAGEVSEDLQTAVNELLVQAQRTDDMVPDVTTPPDVPVVPTL